MRNHGTRHDKTTMYIMVTNDDYQFPVSWAYSASQLSKITGYKDSSILSVLYKFQHGTDHVSKKRKCWRCKTSKYTFRKVPIEQ